MGHFKVCFIGLILAFIMICGCTSFSPASSGTDSVQGTAAEDPVSQTSVTVEKTVETPAAVETEPPVESQAYYSRASDYYLYPEAYEKHDLIYFDDFSGKFSDKNDFNAASIAELGDLNTKSMLTVVDMSDGNSVYEKADDGRKYILLSVTMAPVGESAKTFVTPPASDFLLIDGSETYEPESDICLALGAVVNDDGTIDGQYVIENIGDVYSSRTVYGTLWPSSGVTVGEQTGWLVFDVPDSFKLNKDTYLRMKVGEDEEVYWHLSYLRSDISVKKSPSTGNIEVVFKGGADAGVVRGIEIVVTKPDGTVNTGVREIEGSESEIPVGTKVSAEGSEPGGGQDHVVVYLIRMDGEKFLKYEGDLAVEASSR